MSPLRQILYVSRAASGLSRADIQNLLSEAGRKNWRLNVTGCLLYSGRSFVQLLEGESDVIGPLADRIAVHRWHNGMRILLDRPVDKRRYADWSMGYVYNLDLADRIDTLCAHSPPSEADIEALLAELRPDPVMGPL
jgi:hypothetical protein